MADAAAAVVNVEATATAAATVAAITAVAAVATNQKDLTISPRRSSVIPQAVVEYHIVLGLHPDDRLETNHQTHA